MGPEGVHAELTLGQGIGVGHEAVALLMRRAGIAGSSAILAASTSTRSRPPQISLNVSSLVAFPTSSG